MAHEAFCEDYFTTADKNTVAFVEQVLMWRKKKWPLYATDVLNLMIENNLISAIEVEQIIESTTNKPLDITLPTRYIED